MNIVEAIRDERLFRPLFKDLSTWANWITVLKAIFAIEMSKKELAFYTQCTGRETPPERPVREFWMKKGRRAGWSFISSVTACYLALFHDFSEHLSPGEIGVIQVMASDRAQSGVVFRYIKGILNSSPILSQYVIRETAFQIELSTNILIEVTTASFRTSRGRTVICFIGDEVCFWMDGGSNPAAEIVAAARPGMATISNAKMLIGSSPYMRAGIFFDTFEQCHGKDDPDVLTFEANSLTMNSTLNRDLIAKELERDPIRARSEWLGYWREDVELAFNLDNLKSVVIPGRTQMEPLAGASYECFIDPSAGARDRFTAALGFKDSETNRMVVASLKVWVPPFDPDEVCQELKEVCRAFGVNHVMSDRFGGVWVSSALRKAGLNHTICPVPKSDLYLSLIADVNMRMIELPDDPELIREMQSLERKKSPSGKDRVDHPASGYDDRANSIAGLAHLLRDAHTGEHRVDVMRSSSALEMQSWDGARGSKDDFFRALL